MFINSYLSRSVFYSVCTSAITLLISLLITGNLITSIVICFMITLVILFGYYFVDNLLHTISGFKAKPAVIWLTGLSGSGKTTIANCLVNQLKKKSVRPVLLDGDEIRQIFKLDGFDEDSRKKHNLNIGYISSLLEKQGNIVIVSLISPYTRHKRCRKKYLHQFYRSICRN